MELSIYASNIYLCLEKIVILVSTLFVESLGSIPLNRGLATPGTHTRVSFCLAHHSQLELWAGPCHWPQSLSCLRQGGYKQLHQDPWSPGQSHCCQRVHVHLRADTCVCVFQWAHVSQQGRGWAALPQQGPGSLQPPFQRAKIL